MADAARFLTRHLRPVAVTHGASSASCPTDGPHQPPSRKILPVAFLATVGIAMHLLLRFVFHAAPQVSLAPLYAVLLLGGLPLLVTLARSLLAREFGSDLLAG